ncbi:MAG: hypothetical protein AB7T49_01240 [Oligoflexales bacterium]
MLRFFTFTVVFITFLGCRQERGGGSGVKTDNSQTPAADSTTETPYVACVKKGTSPQPQQDCPKPKAFTECQSLKGVLNKTGMRFCCSDVMKVDAALDKKFSGEGIGSCPREKCAESVDAKLYPTETRDCITDYAHPY